MNVTIFRRNRMACNTRRFVNNWFLFEVIWYLGVRTRHPLRHVKRRCFENVLKGLREVQRSRLTVRKKGKKIKCLETKLQSEKENSKQTRLFLHWQHCWCAKRKKSPPSPPPPPTTSTATTININCIWFVLSNNHCPGLDRPRDEINYRLPQVAIEHAWVSLNSIIHVINPQCNFVENTKTEAKQNKTNEQQ